MKHICEDIVAIGISEVGWVDYEILAMKIGMAATDTTCSVADPNSFSLIMIGIRCTCRT